MIHRLDPPVTLMDESGEQPDRRGSFLRLSFAKREELLEQAVEGFTAGPVRVR